LFCLYELHYGGVDGVDERWEWHPDLIAFRSTLEIAKAANIPECTRPTRTIRRWEETRSSPTTPTTGSATHAPKPSTA
jgi:hypothetical protein